MDEILIQSRPIVSKRWLLLTAGLMWSAVGIMLMSLAFGWLKPLGFLAALPFVLLGILTMLLFYHFSFSKLARRNVDRIEEIDGDKTGLFAFQAWKSYLIIIFMIALGVTLRHYVPIPKPYLAIVYVGVGGGLFLSSFHYYGHLWNGRKGNNGR